MDDKLGRKEKLDVVKLTSKNRKCIGTGKPCYIVQGQLKPQYLLTSMNNAA